jgi:hypothetical protein
MSLPITWIDRIFAKLTITYGREFVARWDNCGVPIMDVKTEWGHELSGFRDHPDAIAYALCNLPDRPPTVLQFREICRKAPPPVVPRLAAPEPKADPARVAAEMAKLRGTLGTAHEGTAPRMNHRAWAPRILARLEAGEKISPTVVAMARDCVALSH